MRSVVVLVLHNPALLPDLLQSWQEAGVPGATVVQSIGMRHIAAQLRRDDIPLMPSLRDLETAAEMPQRTILAVVDDSLIDSIIQATERVTGNLSEPDTGILFAVPTRRVVGGQRS